jgi:hypothetical protein
MRGQSDSQRSAYPVTGDTRNDVIAGKAAEGWPVGRQHPCERITEPLSPIRRAQASQRSWEGPDPMMRIYAARAQKERELISERTKAALTAARARGRVLGGDRGYRPATGPDSGVAATSRRVAAERAAHRLLLEVDRLRSEGVTSMQALARALTERGVPTPREGKLWTHTTVGRLRARTSTKPAVALDLSPAVGASGTWAADPHQSRPLRLHRWSHS